MWLPFTAKINISYTSELWFWSGGWKLQVAVALAAFYTFYCDLNKGK